MNVEVQLNYPYSFSKTTRRLVQFEKSNYIYQNGVFYRVIQSQGKPFVIGVSQGADANTLHIETDRKLLKDEEELVKRIWSTEVDLTTFYESWSRDPDLGKIILERRGMHPVLDPTLFESLIKTIISQQLNLSFAATLQERFIQLTGDVMEYQGISLPVFPTPNQVARFQYEDLRKLQFNQRKAEYIIDLSRMVANGELQLERLWTLSNSEVMEILTRIRGIGYWTAECVLLFGMGRLNLLPAADIGLRNAIRKAYRLRERPNEAEVRKIARNWGSCKSYVTFYLWDWYSIQKKEDG